MSECPRYPLVQAGDQKCQQMRRAGIDRCVKCQVAGVKQDKKENPQMAQIKEEKILGAPKARSRKPEARGLNLLATCIGCGCTDLRACAGGCSWLRVDYRRGIGVCSNCEEHLAKWPAEAVGHSAVEKKDRSASVIKLRVRAQGQGYQEMQLPIRETTIVLDKQILRQVARNMKDLVGIVELQERVIEDLSERIGELEADLVRIGKIRI